LETIISRGEIVSFREENQRLEGKKMMGFIEDQVFFFLRGDFFQVPCWYSKEGEDRIG